MKPLKHALFTVYRMKSLDFKRGALVPLKQAFVENFIANIV